jgi:serine/threonine protein kinase
MVDYRIDAKIKLNNKAEERRPLIVLELAEGGELFEYISKLGRFTPEVCRTYLKQLISAIKYLADIGVSHRDLKPENILFNSDFLLKVSDFGLSRDAKGDHGDFKLRTRVGTEGYKPPEMEAGNYTGIQADIFAAGVVLFIMHTGSPPFLSTKPHDRIYKMIKEKNFTKFWQLHEKSKPLNFFSPEFKRLLNSFFSFEADRRPTFETLGSDDWMNGDELMKDELRDYMLAKAAKLAESDPAKKEIAKIKQQLFKEKSTYLFIQ